MNISGVVVRAYPKDVNPVTMKLEEYEGVEVHGASDDGRLVVTIEKESDAGLADLVVAMQDIPGVLSASMIYHHFEDLGPEEAE